MRIIRNKESKMAERYERVTEVTESDNSDNHIQVAGDRAETGYFNFLATNIVSFIAGVLLLLLAFRFVLMLLNANANNWFANFIYDISHPFVSPFFSLFSYKTQIGGSGSRFEIYTLVAMVVYAVVAYIINRLLALGQRTDS